MSERTDEVCRLIDELSEEEKRVVLNYLRERVPRHPLEQEWGTTAEAILTAIARSADITLRGIRGILAEATFEQYFIPKLQADGWASKTNLGEQAYDFLIEKDAAKVTIQVKLQRKENGDPKEYAARSLKALNCQYERLYVVEVQKTRSGKKGGKATRPYHFGDFDILAVNLHTAAGEWKRFMFTLGSWLLPRKSDPELIEIFQPVSIVPDEYWTNDLNQCIEWFLAGIAKRLYS